MLAGIAREYDLSDSSRFKIAAIGGSALTMLINFLSGAYSFTAPQYLRYWAGQLCMYLFIYKGVCQWLERGLGVITNVAAAESGAEVPNTSEPTVVVYEYDLEPFEVELLDDWQCWLGWGFTALWLLFNLVQNGVLNGAGQELFCCPFSERVGIRHGRIRPGRHRSE